MTTRYSWLGALALAMLVSHGAAADPLISVGPAITNNADVPSYLTDGTYLFGITVPALVAPDDFLLPVSIAHATNLQSWQFTLHFDSSVVQEVDPGDGSSGIFGAAFTPGNLDSVSFIVSGFPFNSLGQVDTVAGAYPSLPSGPTGSGALAYILFAFVPGQERSDPAFTVDGTTVVQATPEPATLALLLAGLAAFGSRRLVRRASTVD